MPNNFESQKKSARNLVLSPNMQAAVGGLLADAALTHRQRFDGSAILELLQSRRSDKEMSGRGTQFATDGQPAGWDTKFSFKAELDAWLAAWAFDFAMGADTVSGAAPYTHAIAFDDTTTQAPTTTLYLEDTAAVKYKVPDMAVSDLTLTIPERGACSLETAFVGTGRWTLGAMVAGPPALAASNYLLGSDCVFSIGPVGDSVSVLGRHLSTTLKISTGVVNHVAPGGGLYGIFMRRGLWKFSLQTTIAAMATDDIWTLLENDTPSALSWNINSGAQAQLAISMPLVHMKAAKLGVNGNMVIWSIEADETTSFYANGAQPLSVSVVNSVAQYLVPA
jgi:hypothetical protein